MGVSLRVRVTMLVASLAAGLTAGPAYSRQSCADTFSESGDRNSGIVYRSSIKIQAVSTTDVIRSIARKFASNGQLGIEASSDLGIVSAYQENDGKKSTFNVVVADAKPSGVDVEIVFRLAPTLHSPAAAVRDFLCEILIAAIPEDERQKLTSGGALATISLSRAEGDVPLTSTVGKFREAGVDVFVKYFFDFPGVKASTRTTDKRGTLIVRSQSDPAQGYLLVRCDTDEKNDLRSVKVGSAGQLIKKGLTGKGDERVPDEDWTIAFTTSQSGSDLWRVVAARDLSPGEYGLWDIAGHGVALFGVDP